MRAFTIRLLPGDDLQQKLIDFVKDKNLSSGEKLKNPINRRNMAILWAHIEINLRMMLSSQITTFSVHHHLRWLIDKSQTSNGKCRLGQNLWRTLWNCFFRHSVRLLHEKSELLDQRIWKNSNKWRYQVSDSIARLTVSKITKNSLITLNKVGTIDPDGQHHMHISISDAEGAVHGGHVFSEHIIYTTGEFESTSKAIKTIQPKSLSGPMTTNIIAVKTALLVDGPSWSLQKSVNKVHKKAESSLSFFLYFAFVYSRLVFVYCNSNCAFNTATWLFRHWFSDR